VFQNGSDSAGGGRAGAGIPILFVGQTGVSEMDVNVNAARNDDVVFRIDSIIVRRNAKFLCDSFDFAVLDLDFSRHQPTVLKDARILNENIKH
jgi:hypothetical protein